MALEAENVGHLTLENLNEQLEQLDRISSDVEDLAANLARSKKILKTLSFGAARNRCVQVLCLLITVLLLVIIALAIMGKDGGTLNVPDTIRNADFG